MMRSLLFLLAGLLVSCTVQVEGPDIVFRDDSKPMFASTRYDPKRMSGAWFQRADFLGGRRDQWSLELSEDGGTLKIESWANLAAGTSKTLKPGMKPGVLVREGRMKIPNRGEAKVSTTLVVIWVDEDFQTAAIAATDNSFAVIIDRHRTGGTSRIEAARDVLAFNGWHIEKMEDTQW